MIFKAPRVVVYQEGKVIREIEAVGGVSLQYGEATVTAKVCIYAMQLVTFSGNVVVYSSEVGTVIADKATYSLATKKMDFTSRGKVELVLNPDKEGRLLRGR
jgi:lipopolysaccharide export system protein LptA